MDLQDFVTQTLVQITKGVEKAQTELSSIGAVVNPQMKSYLKQTEGGFAAFGWPKDGEGRAVLLVQFDVAVTAEKGKHTKGGIGVVAGIIGLGSQGASDQTDSNVSRIKFGIPLMLPTYKANEKAA